MFERDAYRLGQGVRVDLRDLERSMAIAQRPTVISGSEHALLEAIVERWNSPVAELSETCEFLSPVLVRAAQMVQTIGERLPVDALPSGRPDNALALAIARELLVSDPCDEQARRELRDYQKILWLELEVQPSAALTALLRESAAPQFA